MKLKKILISNVLVFFSICAHAYEADIWPSIPFFRGADLCYLNRTVGNAETQYFYNVMGFARQFMNNYYDVSAAANALSQFETYYSTKRNQNLNQLGLTFEANFKSYADELYRIHNPKQRKMGFQNLVPLQTAIKDWVKGHNPPIDPKLLQEVDYMAFGTYSLSPDCTSKIQVTLHLIGKEGREESFIATGEPTEVMQMLAQQIFDFFQLTKFPSHVNVGQFNLEVLGGPNGLVGVSTSIHRAKQYCEMLGARLPSFKELEILALVGGYNGGLQLGTNVWILDSEMLYVPYWQKNGLPIRSPNLVKEKSYSYVCVK